MSVNNVPEVLQLRMILGFVQPFGGALILMCFYVWLRRRQVKDPSLLWLSSSLLSWAIPGGIQLLAWKGRLITNQEYVLTIAYICSPLSSILSAITALQLLRVREAIRLHKLEIWPRLIIWTVAVTSVAALILTLAGTPTGDVFMAGRNLDATSSMIAILTLGLCFCYSFYKYGNKPLIGLTLLTFIYFAWYQFYLAAPGSALASNPFIVALNIWDVATMTMLFIALTLAWGLSNASQLRFRDSEPVEVIVMFIDLRGSTQWVKKVSDGKYVVNFMNKFTQWTLNRASEAPYGLPTVKHTGDGFMFVWEVPDNSVIIDRANAVAGLACALCSGYLSWVQNMPEFYQGVPVSIGIGIAFGSANRLTTEHGSYDYLGLTAHLAAKFQGLARPHGGVVIQDTWELTQELRDQFTKKGKLVIGGESIPIRATDGVKLVVPGKNGWASKNGSSGA